MAHKKALDGLELSIQGNERVFAVLAYPSPVAPQQSRFLFQLMALLGFLVGLGLA